MSSGAKSGRTVIAPRCAKRARGSIKLQPQWHSPFLGLPAEMRNKIYIYTLRDHDISLCYYSETRKKARHHDAPHHRETPAIQLLALGSTCKQTYLDTKGMVFSLNTFRLMFDMEQYDPYGRIVASLPLALLHRVVGLSLRMKACIDRTFWEPLVDMPRLKKIFVNALQPKPRCWSHELERQQWIALQHQDWPAIEMWVVNAGDLKIYYV